MTTYSFYYFHNHYSTPLITGLKLPLCIKPKEIEQITTGPEKAIVLFSLTGQTDKRPEEEQLIKDILSAPKNTYMKGLKSCKKEKMKLLLSTLKTY